MKAQKQKRKEGPSKPVSAFFQGAATVCLAITLAAIGLFACAVPSLTTEALSRACSDESNSPFTEDELVAAAVAARNYTVADNDPEALFTVLGTINLQCIEDGRSGQGAPDLSSVPYADGRFDMQALQSALSKASDRYTLDDEAISHLDDVYHVVKAAEAILIAVAVSAAVLVAAIGVKLGRASVARVLRGAAWTVLAAFIALAAWVAVDFNGFFTFFHSLFFAEGTWLFSYDSLLITMYPPEFWIGMGVVWLTSTVAGCIICLIIGQLLKNNRAARRSA